MSMSRKFTFSNFSMNGTDVLYMYLISIHTVYSVEVDLISQKWLNESFGLSNMRMERQSIITVYSATVRMRSVLTRSVGV